MAPLVSDLQLVVCLVAPPRPRGPPGISRKINLVLYFTENWKTLNLPWSWYIIAACTSSTLAMSGPGRFWKPPWSNTILLISASVCVCRVGMLGCAVSPLSSCPCRVTRPSYSSTVSVLCCQQRLWLQLSCVISPETLNSLISVWKSNTHPRPQCEVFYDRY